MLADSSQMRTNAARKEPSELSQETYLARDVLGTSKPVTVQMIRKGLPPRVVTRLSRHLNIPTISTLKFVNLSKQTYIRRKKTGKLSPQESDRIWRLADIVAKANQLLGNEEEAANWLSSPAPALGGETPLERATTDIGARDVEQLIWRLENGIPA